MSLTAATGAITGLLGPSGCGKTTLMRAVVGVQVVHGGVVEVLDELTVGLDPLLRRDLWATFKALAADGVTLLVSSHVMDEAEHCDALVLMREGHVLANETPDELLEVVAPVRRRTPPWRPARPSS